MLLNIDCRLTVNMVVKLGLTKPQRELPISVATLAAAVLLILLCFPGMFRHISLLAESNATCHSISCSVNKI